MEDYTKFSQNFSASETAYIFEPMPAQRFGSAVDKSSYTVDTGARVQPNGDTFFRIYAPTAKTVEVVVKGMTQKRLYEEHNYDPEYLCAHAQPWMGIPDYKLTLKMNGDFFEGTLPYSKYVAGRCKIIFFVDGVHIVEPHMPVEFTGDRYANFVEIPDPTLEETLIRNVPHGSVTSDVYWSDVMRRFVRQLVYTPPGYRQCGDRYPVVYLQQGRSDRETAWVYAGKVPEIMDNLIADGKAKPTIIVMNDGMLRTPEDGTEKYDGFLRMIVEETVPYVEANYRCIPDKWHRGLAGLSMGGMQACKGGLEHPELFSSLGLFSCSIRIRDIELDFDKSPHLLRLRDDPAYADRQFRVIFRGNGIGETARDPVVLEDDKWIAAHGIDKLNCYKRVVYPENCGEHDWSTFRRCFRDYIQIAFPD